MAAKERHIDDNIEAVLRTFKITNLKKEQRLILDNLIEGNDCLAVLPTGYGKSLPYQMYLPGVRRLGLSSASGKFLVCCPLVLLMEDQVKRLSTYDFISAAYAGSDQETNCLIQEGNIDIIFASPEILVGDKHWREALQGLDISLIIVDEFHTIATWGGIGKDEERNTFRKWFRHICELRSLFPHATVLALSATCTRVIQKRVIDVLGIDDSVTRITMSPNRENIKY